MLKHRTITVGVVIFLVLVASEGYSETIKCFVLPKPWEATIELNNFEPKPLMGGPKTVLAGSTTDGVNLTIIVERTEPGKTPAEIREIYGSRSLEFGGRAETAERLDINGTAVLLFRWAEPNLPDVNQSLAEWARKGAANMWSFHGYLVKDNMAFDIHLSGDITQHPKKKMLNIIKSFRVKPSPEVGALTAMIAELGQKTDLREKIKIAHQFTEKYPNNPIGWLLLGERYLNVQELEKAKSAYRKALEKHRIQPFGSPTMLLTCYDALGMCYGMSHQYGLSRKYLESGYKLAKKMNYPEGTAQLAYNLACMYAETNDAANAMKYLTESVRLSPLRKQEARDDESFVKIKGSTEFRDLIFE